jgi:hypothetical protein
MAGILLVGQFMFLKDIKDLLWLGEANEVRTAIVSSDKIIFIPELSY